MSRCKCQPGAHATNEVAFAQALDYNSIDWEEQYPNHCYICHVANVDETDDTTTCGPHCERDTS